VLREVGESSIALEWSQHHSGRTSEARKLRAKESSRDAGTGTGWLLLLQPLLRETDINTTTVHNAKSTPVAAATLGAELLQQTTAYEKKTAVPHSTSARGPLFQPFRCFNLFLRFSRNITTTSEPHSERLNPELKTTSPSLLRTFALSDAAITAKSLFFSTLVPGTKEDEQEGVRVAAPPPLTLSTPSSVAEAWLICSLNCESTFATARAMRWWFRRTFSWWGSSVVGFAGKPAG